MDVKPAMAWKVTGAILLGLAVAMGFHFFPRKEPPPRPSSDATTPTPIVSAAEAEIRYPIARAPVEPMGPPDQPLPLLIDSDPVVLGALAGLVGLETPAALLRSENIIYRVVTTVDNLPRSKLAPQILPWQPVGAPFLVAEQAGSLMIAQANAARYTPYVDFMVAVDSQALVAQYVRYYPLFQQAFRELGYPTGYFNDRLVEVIDHLLAAPDSTQAVTLVQPKVFYEFADPELQAASAGHKLLLRMGSENAQRVKAKLGEIRAAITEQSPTGRAE